MIRTLRLGVLLCVLWPVAGLMAQDIPLEWWDRPRSAQAVMALPVLRKIVLTHLGRAQSQLVIAHGASAEMTHQAEELRAWLLALGVDGRRLQLRVDGELKQLRVELIDGR